MITSFTKIHNLDNFIDVDLSKATVTEKVDGSQITWMLSEDGLEIASKNCTIYTDQTGFTGDKLFTKAVEIIVQMRSKLQLNTQYYAEYLKTPKHVSIQYDNTPKNNLMLFAVKEDCIWQGHIEVCAHARHLGIDEPQLVSTYKNDSYLGGTREGLVYSIISDDCTSITKYKKVSDQFLEVKKELKERKKAMRGSKVDSWSEFKERFRTEARWNKAIQHLREANKLTETNKDIGQLHKEVMQDIISEELDNINQYLYKNYTKDLLKHAVEGLAEFYSNYLKTK